MNNNTELDSLLGIMNNNANVPTQTVPNNQNTMSQNNVNVMDFLMGGGQVPDVMPTNDIKRDIRPAPTTDQIQSMNDAPFQSLTNYTVPENTRSIEKQQMDTSKLLADVVSGGEEPKEEPPKVDTSKLLEDVVSGGEKESPKVDTSKLLEDVVSGGESNSHEDVVTPVVNENIVEAPSINNAEEQINTPIEPNAQEITEAIPSIPAIPNTDEISVPNIPITEEVSIPDIPSNVPVEVPQVPKEEPKIDPNNAIADTFSFVNTEPPTNPVLEANTLIGPPLQQEVKEVPQETPQPAPAKTEVQPAVPAMPEFEPIASTESTSIQTQTYKEANINEKKKKEFNPDRYKLPVLLVLAAAFTFMTIQIVPQAIDQDLGILIVVLLVFGSLWIVLIIAILKSLKKK